MLWTIGSKDRTWPSVFSRIVILRTFYLMTGLAGGVFSPYLSLLFTQDGLSASAIGTVLSAGTLIAILVQPVWGIVVDRFRITRMTLMLTFLVPAMLAPVYTVHIALALFLSYAISTVFSSPQAPIADSLAVVTARGAGTSYGTIRSFGSLGFALGGYAGGVYLAQFPMHTLWMPYAALSLLGAASIVLYPRMAQPGRLVARSMPKGGVREVLSSRKFVLFLLGGFLVSETLTAFNTYFVLSFREIGGSLSTTGIAFAVASATNIPAMLLAAKVIARVGRERTMMLAALVYVVRWGVQALVPIPAVAIGIQLLHGASFGFFYVAAVDFVSRSAKAEWQATAQSVFGMVCGGVAGIVGNVLNGYLLHVGGSSLMYGVCAALSGLSALCFWGVVRMPADGTAVANADV